MNLFIQIPKDKRAKREECRQQIIFAEQQMEEKIKEHSVTCAICDKSLNSRFRSASRFNKESYELHLHPVHVDCVKDNASLTEVFGSEKSYYDLSSLDLLLMSGMVNHLTDLEKEGKLPDIPEVEESLVNFPSPETIGEPFYTLIEMIDGKITGNVISNFHNNEQMPYLYVSKDIAVQSKKEGNRNMQLKNYEVAGVSRKFLDGILNSNKNIMVIMDIQGSRATAISHTGAEIKDAMKTGGWLDNIIKMQNK
jgi:hypothetical protein